MTGGTTARTSPPSPLPVWALVALFGALTCLKALFISAYRSTDFEVHRNWLAITSSRPLSDWYYESTSQWTLDYPPFFAWFEYLLSHAAATFDAKMLRVENLGYASSATVLFQRSSVMAADLLLLLAVNKLRRASFAGGAGTALCILANFGLFVVDHIHFQYNGFLFAIMLLSLAYLAEGRAIIGSVLFAALLNFKHIYVYVAPAVFMFLLRSYCFQEKSSESDDRGEKRETRADDQQQQAPHRNRHQHKQHQPSATSFTIFGFHPLRFLALGAVVVAVFALSFGPFVYMGQLEQVLSRLFPFKRGLTHAYWAANAWAIYNGADKAISVVLGAASGSGAFTGGLVTDKQHYAYLVDIPPIATFALTFIAMLPLLLHQFFRRERLSGTDVFLGVTVCAYASFLFGWHVHEKATLLFQIPLSVIAYSHSRLSHAHVLAQLSGGYALFPLIFTEKEAYAVPALFVAYMCLVLYTHYDASQTFQLTLWEKAYAAGFVALHAGKGLLSFVAGDRLPFLPLMLTSLYCSIGIFWSFLLVYYHALCSPPQQKEKTR